MIELFNKSDFDFEILSIPNSESRKYFNSKGHSQRVPLKCC